MGMKNLWTVLPATATPHSLNVNFSPTAPAHCYFQSDLMTATAMV